MIATLLEAAGFTAYELGANVKVQRFIKAIRGSRPDILAMSALFDNDCT
jgi:methanogenic corrinoid protein MtbC1